MPNNGIPEYFASLRYIERKTSYWGHIEGTTKPRGRHRYCHGIPLFGKNTMLLFKLPKVYRGFFASLRYIRQFTVHWTKISYWGTTKPRGGYQYPLLSRHTYFWQNIRCRFSFCLGFRGRVFFLVVPKKPECNKYMSYTYHSRNTAVTTQTQQGTTFY